MARKRMISPDIHTDAKYIQLSHIGRLLFTGMMNHADDEGIFENNEIEMKCKVFPADNVKLDVIKDCINQMIKLKLLEEGENKLLKYKNWHNYQKINHPTPSKYIFIPTIEEKKEDSGSPNVELSEDSSRTPSQYSIDKNSIDKVSIDKNRSSKKNQDFSFERFYSIYPRKGTKKDSIVKWKYILKRDLKPLFDGLDKWVAYWLGEKIDKQYIPNPLTWLNQRRWEDEDIPVANPDKDIKFKDPLDKEIYNRNQNLAKQSERTRMYMQEANDKAIDEVPNLLEDFKAKKKESNAQPIGEVIGQYMAQAEPDTSTDG